MIIQNGTIEVKRKQGTGIDPVTGHPTEPYREYWGEPIPCQAIPRVNLQARDSNGEHIKSVSYEILIEEREFCGEQILLRDMSGRVVGEYPVISALPLDAVSEVQILI